MFRWVVILRRYLRQNSIKALSAYWTNILLGSASLSSIDYSRSLIFFFSCSWVVKDTAGGDWGFPAFFKNRLIAFEVSLNLQLSFLLLRWCFIFLWFFSRLASAHISRSLGYFIFFVFLKERIASYEMTSERRFFNTFSWFLRRRRKTESLGSIWIDRGVHFLNQRFYFARVSQPLIIRDWTSSLSERAEILSKSHL